MNGFALGLLAGFALNTETGRKFINNLEDKAKEVVKAATEKEEPNEQQENSRNAVEG